MLDRGGRAASPVNPAKAAAAANFNLVTVTDTLYWFLLTAGGHLLEWLA
jgi:hypothetical protein